VRGRNFDIIFDERYVWYSSAASVRSGSQ